LLPNRKERTLTDPDEGISIFLSTDIKMAQYSELSHFILIARTDTKGNTNWGTFSVTFSVFATGNGTW